jgi:hypothetical protein
MKLDPRLEFLKDPIVLFCISALILLASIYIYIECPEDLPQWLETEFVAE